MVLARRYASVWVCGFALALLAPVSGRAHEGTQTHHVAGIAHSNTTNPWNVTFEVHTSSDPFGPEGHVHLKTGLHTHPQLLLVECAVVKPLGVGRHEIFMSARNIATRKLWFLHAVDQPSPSLDTIYVSNYLGQFAGPCGITSGPDQANLVGVVAFKDK